jgi:alpha-L-fucosidase
VVEANSSTRWFEDSSDVQIFDVVVKNTGNVWLTTQDKLTVYVDSPSLITTRPASVKRLRPNDSAIVEVGVVNKPNVTDGSSGPATVVAEWNSQGKSSLDITATYGIPTYNPTKSSVDQHEAPDWWRKAKFGIFIHWGLYSIPAWGNVGANESYAEW